MRSGGDAHRSSSNRSKERIKWKKTNTGYLFPSSFLYRRGGTPLDTNRAPSLPSGPRTTPRPAPPRSQPGKLSPSVQERNRMSRRKKAPKSGGSKKKEDPAPQDVDDGMDFFAEPVSALLAPRSECAATAAHRGSRVHSYFPPPAHHLAN